jgi:hypothetical protein
MAWDTTRETLKLLLNLIADMHKKRSQYIKMMFFELEDELSTLANIHRRLAEAELNIRGWWINPRLILSIGLRSRQTAPRSRCKSPHCISAH